MVLAPSVAGLFKWRQFEPEIILQAVGWYLRFSLSYRDVEELLAERGVAELPDSSNRAFYRRQLSGWCYRANRGKGP
jgi:transposase-like protein